VSHGAAGADPLIGLNFGVLVGQVGGQGPTDDLVVERRSGIAEGQRQIGMHGVPVVLLPTWGWPGSVAFSMPCFIVVSSAVCDRYGLTLASIHATTAPGTRPQREAFVPAAVEQLTGSGSAQQRSPDRCPDAQRSRRQSACQVSLHSTPPVSGTTLRADIADMDKSTARNVRLGDNRRCVVLPRMGPTPTEGAS